MPATPLDSSIYRELFGDPELARLFTDSAEVRAMLLVEGALAKAQGKLGLIPEVSAAFLHRASLEIALDPAALAPATGRNGVPVPALVQAARAELGAPEHAAWLHFGATSQDIADTALVLRLRQAVSILERRLEALIRTLGKLAATHAERPMLARTYGQAAVPTSFGATVATWGMPLLRLRSRLQDLKPRLLVVSLSGAAGTLAAMGARGPAVRAALAEGLGLGDPEESWHAARDRITELSGWLAGVAASLGKMAEDLVLMAQTGREEVTAGPAGASSTMPQKQNPVGASSLVALARLGVALDAALQGASMPREARDGAAWMVEWLALPQLVLVAGRALATAGALAEDLAPDPEGLGRPLETGLRLWAAEALTFALASSMPRTEAEAATRALVAEARATGTPLPELAQRRFPEADWAERLSARALLGEAPALARRFAAAANAL